MERTDTESELIGGLRVSTYGHGPPILLIHGFGANSFTWSKIIGPLALHHKIVTLDLKGFGHSEKPDDGRYSLLDQSAAVLRVIDELALEGITLVGHSMGGGVALLSAMALAREAPGRLHRLVLIDSISCPQRLPFFIVLLRLPLIGPFVLRIVPATWSVRAILRFAYYDAGQIGRAFVSAYAAPLRHRDGRVALVATAREMIPPDLDSVVAQYPTIQVPVLVLWGREDRIVPLSVSACLRDAIPAARFVVLDYCGHLPQEEWPELTVFRLREFISEAERARASPPGAALPT
jgi:pimeloyl-ACP methyl ester carboxylesterase